MTPPTTTTAPAAPALTERRASRRGILLLVVSAASLACAPLVATQIYQEGITPTTMLAVRFGIAASLFWILVAATRRRLPPRRLALRGLLQGAVLYAVQALCFFTGIRLTGASITTVVFYLYPALVVVVAVVFGRDRFSALRFAALPFAIGGVALTALGAGAGAVDGKGVLLALCSAFTYIGFSLHGDSLSVRADPFVLTALLATGSTASFVVYGLATGELHGPVTAVGLGWIATIACTSLLAYATFFIGIREAGPSLTALLAMLEPVFVLVVAGTVLGEHLVPLQLAGAGLVLASIVVVNAVELRRGGSRPA